MTNTILYFEILVLVSATFTNHYKKCQDKRNKEIIFRKLKIKKNRWKKRPKMSKEKALKNEKSLLQ